MKKIVCFSIVCVSLLLVGYLMSPYYVSYSFISSIKQGEAEKAVSYVDFPRVRLSLKQQFSASMNNDQAADPLSDAMATAFLPMLEKMVEVTIDQILTPELFIKFIQSGEVKSLGSREKEVEFVSQKESSDELTWFAFFDSVDRFRIDLGDLVVYLKFVDWSWKLVAVGDADLLDMGESGRMAVKENLFIEDQVETSINVIPRAIEDIEEFKKSIEEVFFIQSDFGDTVNIEADFFEITVPKILDPKVVLFKGLSSSGEVVTRDYTAEEKAKREKYQSYFLGGVWRESFKKTKADLAVEVVYGKCEITVPTKINNVTLYLSDLGKEKPIGNHWVSLDEVSNGKASFTIYSEHEIDTQIFSADTKNSKNQFLKLTGQSSISQLAAVNHPDFESPVFTANIYLKIAGTPSSINVYEIAEKQRLKIPFTATRKPEVSFGELKYPVDKTRYKEPKNEPKLESVDDEDLENIIVELKKEVDSSKNIKKYLHVTLPEISNNYFAEINYDGVEASLGGNTINFKPFKEHNGLSSFKMYFGNPEDEWSGQSDSVDFDKVDGVIKLRYPASIAIERVYQGESKEGVSLGGESFSIDDAKEMPSYNIVWPVSSARAFSKDGREIVILDDSSFWNKKGSHLVYWGSPYYVEYKVVKKWLDVEIKVDKSTLDVIEIKPTSIW